MQQSFSDKELTTEEWRDVLNFEGWYSISNLGRVRRDMPSRYMPHVGHLIKPYPTGGKGNQYPAVGLLRHSQRTIRRIHILVAEAFLGPRPLGLQVNHKDGNTFNARLTNLEYVTPKMNTWHSDKILNRVIPTRARGEQNGASKLKATDVLTIRHLLHKRIAVKQIAENFGISPTTIGRIKNGRLWTHL